MADSELQQLEKLVAGKKRKFELAAKELELAEAQLAAKRARLEGADAPPLPLILPLATAAPPTCPDNHLPQLPNPSNVLHLLPQQTTVNGPSLTGLSSELTVPTPHPRHVEPEPALQMQPLSLPGGSDDEFVAETLETVSHILCQIRATEDTCPVNNPNGPSVLKLMTNSRLLSFFPLLSLIMLCLTISCGLQCRIIREEFGKIGHSDILANMKTAIGLEHLKAKSLMGQAFAATAFNLAQYWTNRFRYPVALKNFTWCLFYRHGGGCIDFLRGPCGHMFNENAVCVIVDLMALMFPSKTTTITHGVESQRFPSFEQGVSGKRVDLFVRYVVLMMFDQL